GHTRTVSERVERAIRDAITAKGPITFAEFMDIALYGHGGYYERPRVGAEGDFVTSPHVHPVFGQLLARALRAIHDLLSLPAPFRIVEVGAGDGTLAKQLLRGMGDLRIDYRAVEIGRGARADLEHLLGGGAISSELDAPTDVVV